MAFVWDNEGRGNIDLYVKMVDSSTALQLTNDTAVEFSPAWSADGRQIAFAKRRQAQGIFAVSPLGGPEQKISSFNSAGPISWSPDGKYLAVAQAYTQRSETGAGALYLVSADTGESKLFLEPSRGRWYYSPTFAPDGRTLAFAECLGRPASSALCDVSLIRLGPGFIPDGNARRVAQAKALSGIAWTADSQSLIYDAGIEGYLSLWRVQTRGGTQPQRFELAGERAQGPAAARNGKRLAFTRVDREYQLRRLQAGGREESFLASKAMDGNPEFSPDGQRVVFTSTRGLQGATLWLARSDGTGAVQLTRGPEDQGSPSWSPDGRWIAFDGQDSGGNYQVKIVDSSGGQPRQLTGGSFNHSAPRWSRDGKWIYFSSTRSGRDEIWRMPSEGGRAVQITQDGGVAAAESSDGATLFYVKGTPFGTLRSRPMVGGEVKEVLQSVWSRNFVVLNDGIYYVHATPDLKFEIRFYSFEDHRDSTITSVEGYLTLGFSVSPDRKTFLFTRVSGGSSLVMIENFR